MPSLFSAAQIDRLRRYFILDRVDMRLEWGSNGATVKTGASLAATSIALQGLGVGTLTAGTPFKVFSAGLWRTYKVAADVTVGTGMSAGLATVTFSPGLSIAAAVNDRITASPEFGGDYNRKKEREYFSDADIQDLAMRAYQWRAREITEAQDPEEARMKATAALAIRQMLSDQEFRSVLYSDQPPAMITAADTALAKLERLSQQWESELSPNEMGVHVIPAVR